MALSDRAKGCLGLLGLSVVFVVLLVAILRFASWRQQSLSPKPAPTPTLTPEQLQQSARRQRETIDRKEKLRQVIARQEAEAAHQRQAEEAAWLKTRAGQVWKEHRDWDRNDCQVIAKRRVRLGLTEEQCRAAWGAPDHVRRSIEPGHTTTLLCYGDFCQRSLYFVDDRLLRIEQ